MHASGPSSNPSRVPTFLEPLPTLAPGPPPQVLQHNEIPAAATRNASGTSKHHPRMQIFNGSGFRSFTGPTFPPEQQNLSKTQCLRLPEHFARPGLLSYDSSPVRSSSLLIVSLLTLGWLVGLTGCIFP